MYKHVSFMRICDCSIFRILPHFRIFQQSVHITCFFSHELSFSTAMLIFFVFLLPISITFCYLNHLFANRMAPSTCPDPCGTRWGSWFQAILYHISTTYLVFMRFAYFFKMPHETDMPKYGNAGGNRVCCVQMVLQRMPMTTTCWHPWRRPATTTRWSIQCRRVAVSTCTASIQGTTEAADTKLLFISFANTSIKQTATQHSIQKIRYEMLF